MDEDPIFRHKIELKLQKLQRNGATHKIFDLMSKKTCSSEEEPLETFREMKLRNIGLLYNKYKVLIN